MERIFRALAAGLQAAAAELEKRDEESAKEWLQARADERYAAAILNGLEHSAREYHDGKWEIKTVDDLRQAALSGVLLRTPNVGRKALAWAREQFR